MKLSIKVGQSCNRFNSSIVPELPRLWKDLFAGVDIRVVFKFAQYSLLARYIYKLCVTILLHYMYISKCMVVQFV